MSVAVLFLLVALLSVAFADEYLTPKMAQVDDYKVVGTGKFGSTLYEVKVQQSTYGTVSPFLLDLTAGDSYNSGFDTGMLFGNQYVDNINSLFKSMIGDSWYENAAQNIVFKFLDNQWEYLSQQLPEEYKKEFEGLSAGGESIGLSGFEKDVGKIAQRGVVLANFPGSVENLKFIIEEEKKKAFENGNVWDVILEKALLAWFNKHKSKFQGFQCSNYGVWGSRTVNGELYTGRNLDWLKDTGVSTYKLITVHHPVNGYSHATFGFAGIWGAITGMSSKGLTVHEANLESNDITFYGFPWLLRLRSIMSYSNNLESALALWQDTNNTVGFNHGVGSASDGTAILLETMAHNTAIFGSMDTREVASSTGVPRTDAVYRTNHGYDPYTVEHYMWNNTNAYKDSLQRYNLFPVALDSYESNEVSISAIQAVNITSIVASKGSEKPYNCIAPFPNGANVLSATFAPKQLIAYIAWESGTGDTDWTPAACSTYLEINLNKFF